MASVNVETEIELLKRPEGETSWLKATTTEDKLYFPEDLIEYEKRFLVWEMLFYLVIV